MKALDLVFLWHMHQPDYRDHGATSTDPSESTAPRGLFSRRRAPFWSRGFLRGSGGTVRETAGKFVLPWVYLHAIKDYVDMAAHLERHPRIRCVVNFVPVLLDQIEDYAQQFACGQFRDPLLHVLATPDLEDICEEDRRLLLSSCFSCNFTTMVAPFPGYKRLHDLYLLVSQDSESAPKYLSSAYFADLVTWYHLAWTGETERRRNPLLTRLMSQGRDFSANDRQQLLAAIGELITGLLPRWRALAARGQVELSSTPHTHPLSPLMLDFQAARESLPAAPLPEHAAYPGGRQRVSTHIDVARASHARRFGAPPVGMWPAEGAVSEEFVKQLAAAGCRWIASGEGVLHGSLAKSKVADPRATCRPWQLAMAPGLTMFFRNEALSDRIGFDYSKWNGGDAASDLVRQLEAILDAAADDEEPVVSIILDGENAWDHYPYNGYYFFEALYELLAAHPRIRTTTYAQLLARAKSPHVAKLPRLMAGSWVYGTMSTWIGDAAKNRAWDLLCDAKASYDRVVAGGQLDADELVAVEAQLAICESSDWFWWFGDYNPSGAVASFDSLYRRNLTRLYRLLHLEPPATIETPICSGSATAEGGSMLRVTAAPD